MLEDDKQLSLTIKVNSGCPEKCSVVVSFGTKPDKVDNCAVQANVTKEELSPGESGVFTVAADSVSRESGEDYCFFVILCGKLGEIRYK